MYLNFRQFSAGVVILFVGIAIGFAQDSKEESEATYIFCTA